MSLVRISEKLAVAEQPSPGAFRQFKVSRPSSTIIPTERSRINRDLLPKSAQPKTLASATASSLLLLLKSQKPMCGLFRKPSPMRPDLYWPTAGAARVR